MRMIAEADWLKKGISANALQAWIRENTKDIERLIRFMAEEATTA